jgi:type IV secretion system protein VirB1
MPFIDAAFYQHCAPTVAVETMRAVVAHESRERPWALGVNGSYKLARQPASYEEAVSWAKWLIDNRYNIDMGLSQVNSANLGRLKLSVEQVYEPCVNLSAGASILTGNYVLAQQSLKGDEAYIAALSQYNTGSFSRGVSNGYVAKVLRQAGVSSEVIERVKPKLMERGAAHVSRKKVEQGKSQSLNPYTASTEARGSP